MSKTYKIKVNQGADSAKFVDIPQVGTSGKALTVKAVPGGKYQLMDASTGFAPENIRATRLGKDLQVFFEGRGQADLVIEDYYEVTPEGFNGLIGESESGRFYEYIPESAVGNTAVPLLADGSTQVGMALGGAEINASGAAVGALVAAAGLNPLLLAPLALLGAAAGGSSSSATTDTTPPVIKSAKLHLDDDTGAKDNVTSDKTPRISGETEANADVSVEVNGKTYTGKADANGMFVIQVPDADALADAFYTPKVTATDAAKNKSAVFDGTPFKVDSSSDGGGNTTDNKSATVKITKATVDTGVSDSDFVTKGPVTEFSGTLSNFTGTPGDKVKLELLDNDGKPLDPVIEGTVTPTALNGVWSWKWIPVDTDTTTNLPEVLKDGNYTLKATIVTSAGVAFTQATASATQALTIDNLADGPNTKALVEILSITQDSGPSDSDFYTNDQTLVFKGNYTTFTPNGDLIKLELKNEKGEVVDTQYIKPEGVSTTAQNGPWTWDRTGKAALPEGNYTLFATVVDTAGNSLSGKDEQAITIDLTGGKDGSGQVSITKMSFDSGIGDANHVSRSDFKTNDNSPEFKGKVENSTGVQWLEVRLHNEADGTDTSKDLITTIEVKAGTTDWTWAPLTPATGLPDAKYKLTAQVVDLAGNPLTDSNNKPIYSEKDVVIDTRGPVDPTDPNNGVDLSTIKILGNGDTGSSSSDFITKAGEKEGDFLSFGGDFSKTFKPESGGSVWVEVIDRITGVVKTAGYGNITSTSWSFNTKGALAEGNYVVKATLLDQASNMVSSIDHLLVIDRTIKAIQPVTTTSAIISSYIVSTDELGNYSFESKTTLNELIKFSKDYLGGYFDLRELSGKNFGGADNFKIIFHDLAGNEVLINEPLQNYNFALDAELFKAADSINSQPLPSPGHTTAQPTVIGNVGETLKIIGVTSFDMSTLYDGIDAIADRAAVNHVDLLSNTQSQTLNLSVQDVLALGIGESYLSNGTHEGKIQMRIDGANNDIVNLTNEKDASGNNLWTVNVNTTVTLQGIPDIFYYQATNAAAGLEVFIQTGVQIHIV